jgi:demethylmenaquinone methyltransferase/2-methoxy-6-polyprenyl-1,4-benzoquinol methylase
LATPYKHSNKGKKEQVKKMFDNIAHKYDFLNHFLSLGIDKLWRRKIVKIISKLKHDKQLDIATGTGDLAFACSKLDIKEIIGTDISQGMLDKAIEKSKKKQKENIKFEIGDCENLKYSNSEFDIITCAFGVRNFENLEKGIAEIYRTLNENGTAIILEFSEPRKFPIKHLYNFYFDNILPFFGRIISKDNSAYEYLPESVHQFPDGIDFLNILKSAGFVETQELRLSFGIASIYIAKKPHNI